MPNLWQKVQKQFLSNGIQPEDHINFRQAESKKNGTYWKAQIRFNVLKPFESADGSIKAVRVIKSTDYASMDLFYADAKTKRDEMQEQANAVKAMRKPGNHISVPQIARAGTRLPHTLDFIMGYTSTGTAYERDNAFDKVFADREYNTLYAYRRKYLNYIRQDFGSTPIESIDVRQVEENLKQAGAKLGETAIKQLKSVWSMLFEVAYYNHWRDDNPAAHVRLQMYKAVNQDAAEARALGTRKERRTVSDEDFAKIIDIVLDPRKHTKKDSVSGSDMKSRKSSSVPAAYTRQMIAHALILMRYSGIRPAECFGLMRKDFTAIRDDDGNVTGGTIFIRHAAVRSKGNKRCVHEPKTKKSRSVIYISKDTANVVLDMIERSNARVLTHAQPIYDTDGINQFNPADFIFTNYYGVLPDLSKIATCIRDWIRPYGLEYSMYTNRHQFLSDLARADGIAAAQQQARHTNVATTAGYLDESTDEQRAVVDSITADISAKVKNY
ncbi:MAG: site-specific integrase [Lactimicrobium massiliense]|nr:site-specific integrase [Lactimicrobium massiliense]MDD6560748.1 site-specific integrase [Lactimicrobium massiliense]